MNPCLRCGKRREHAFHDPRARVYREDRHEYDGRFRCSNCGDRSYIAFRFGGSEALLCSSCTVTAVEL